MSVCSEATVQREVCGDRGVCLQGGRCAEGGLLWKPEDTGLLLLKQVSVSWGKALTFLNSFRQPVGRNPFSDVICQISCILYLYYNS